MARPPAPRFSRRTPGPEYRGGSDTGPMSREGLGFTPATPTSYGNTNFLVGGVVFQMATFHPRTQSSHGGQTSFPKQGLYYCRFSRSIKAGQPHRAPGKVKVGPGQVGYVFNGEVHRLPWLPSRGTPSSGQRMPGWPAERQPEVRAVPASPIPHLRFQTTNCVH